MVLGFASQAQASSLTLDTSFGSVPVSGEIGIEFDVADDGNSVTILIDTTDLSSPEWIKELYLNVSTDPSALSADFANSTSSLADADFGANAFKAGGDGYHDILLKFETANRNRLAAGGIYEVVLLGTGLTEAQFHDLGTTSDVGTFYAVAKVNSTGSDGEGSDWVGAVPEPSGVLLFGLGAMIVGTHARRRRG